MSTTLIIGETVEILTGKRAHTYGTVQGLRDDAVRVKPFSDIGSFWYDPSDLRRAATPTSPRFNVGDRVRIVAPDPESTYAPDHERLATIVKHDTTDDEYPWQIEVDDPGGFTNWAKDSELEPAYAAHTALPLAFKRGDLARYTKPGQHEDHTVTILGPAPYWPGEPEPRWSEPEPRWKIKCPGSVNPAARWHTHDVEWISDERFLVPALPSEKPDTYQLTIHLDLTLEQIKALGLGRDALSPFGPRDHETKILMLDVLADTEPRNISFNRTWIKP